MNVDAGRVALGVLALGIATSRGITTFDEAIHLDRAISWSRGEATLSLDPGDLWVPTRPVAGGLFYDDGEGLRSASPPGLSALALPLVAPFAWLDGAPVDTGPLVRGDPFEDVLPPLARDARVVAFSLIGPISAALAALFVLLAIRALELSERAQIFGVGALVLGSPMLAYAGTCWTQLPLTAALAYALYQACERERRPGVPATGLGVALALMVLIRVECLLFALPFGVATWQTDRRWRKSPSRSMLRLIAPVSLAVIGLALLGLPARGDGWSLSTMLVGVPGLLVSPRAGLLVYAPFVLCAPFGLRALRDRPPLLWPLAGVPLICVAIYGGWFDWHASLAYGPRFLLPALPCLALAFAAVVDRVPRTSFALVAAGLVVSLPGAMVAHGRIAETDSFLDPAPLSAYATWPAVDWAILDSPGFAVALLFVAIAGMAWEAHGWRRASSPRG